MPEIKALVQQLADNWDLLQQLLGVQDVTDPCLQMECLLQFVARAQSGYWGISQGAIVPLTEGGLPLDLESLDHVFMQMRKKPAPQGFLQQLLGTSKPLVVRAAEITNSECIPCGDSTE